MWVARFVAYRYLWRASRRTFTHRLALLSMGMVCAGALALVVGMSTFNGMEGFLRQSLGQSDPDALLRLKTRGRFVYSDSLAQWLDAQSAISCHSPILSDHLLVRHKANEMIAQIKGVQISCLAQSPWQEVVYPKDVFKTLRSLPKQALLGIGVQRTLQIPLLENSPGNAMQLIYPTQVIGFDQRSLYRSQSVQGAGVFITQSILDDQLIIVPWQAAQKLFNSPQGCDAIELYLHKPKQGAHFVENLDIPPQYELLEAAALHQDLYRLLRIERFFVVLAFSFILGVAFLGLFFALTTSYLNKRMALRTLQAMGATRWFCASIFLYQGAFIALIGSIVGISLALALCFCQDQFGWISLGTYQGYSIPYPVAVHVSDLLWIGGGLLLLTLVAAARPAWQAAKYPQPV